MFFGWASLLFSVVLARSNVILTIPNVTAINDALVATSNCTIPPGVKSQIEMLQGSFGNNLIGNGTLTLPILLATPDPEGCPPGHLNYTCSEGCIVLIRRGSCSFVEKSHYVNGSGAQAVIVYDNAATTDLSAMGGEDERFTINPGTPAYFMGYEGGNAIATALTRKIPVTGEMETTWEIDESEWQALRDIANNMTLGVCDGKPPLGCTLCNITHCGFGDARPWSELMHNSTYDVDPCLYRIAGTRCVDGHIVEIDMPYPLVGSVPAAFGNLPYLETVIFTAPGLISDVGCVFQPLTRLMSLDISGNKLTTFPGCSATPSLLSLDLRSNNITHLPGSIANAHNLQQLLIGSNLLTSLPPEIGAMTELVDFRCEKNLLTTLPAELGNLTNLEILYAVDNLITDIPASVLALDMIQLYVSGNKLTYLNFTRASELRILFAEANNLTAIPPFVTQMTRLQQLYLSDNQISGPAPMFPDFPWLRYLALDGNHFTGSVPTLNTSTRLLALYLFNNQFSGPLPSSWSNLLSLQLLRLQNNLIAPPIHVMRALPILRVVDLSHNNLSLPSMIPLSGPNDAGALIFASVPTTIRSINMAYNRIAGHMDTSWSGPLRELAIINVSHNMITSSRGFTAIPTLTTFDLSFNKLESVDETLPASTALQLISYKGNPTLKMQSKELPSWLAPQEPTVLYEDQRLLCLTVGLSPSVSASSSASFQISFDPEFFNDTYCECIPGTFGKPPQCDPIPNFFRVRGVNEAIADSDFGVHRQIPGADIVFGSPVSSSTKRVRVTELELSFGPNFTSFTDLLEVYAGDEGLKGPRVISIRGSDSDINQVENFDYASVTKLYSENISGVERPAMRLQVYADEVVIHFQSRASKGEHFSAVFTQIYDCPHGYLPHDSDSILTCKPIVFPFELSLPIQAILYFAVTVTTIAIVVTIVLFTKHRKTRVVRAASYLFSVLTLGSLLVFLFGSLLYAAIPHGTMVCHARPWLTFAPLVALLSFFISKVNRVRNIFGSTKLKSSSKNLRAIRLLQLCAVLVGIMVILLIIYSSVPLVTETERETSERNSDGSLTLLLEHTCVSNGDALFLIWCTLTGLYIFGILAWGIYNAYAIRNTPSAFNESTHILQCLVGLLTLITLCGLFLLVIPGNPNLVLVVWGLGQCIAAIFIFSTLFGPKLVALARSGGKGSDNNANVTGMRSGSNINISTTGSQMRAVGSETGSYSREGDTLPKTELEIMADRLDAAEKALKAQRAQFEVMFREWGWTGEFH